ncbi:MAG: diacylglycerol/lipid kinase family protein [Candidatus Hodarchaeales archaeon]|jgi:YegS/Rv2252/BmrU family lipid kinase
MVKALVVVNPTAGGGRSKSRLPLIKQTLAKIGIEAEYEQTIGPRDATRITRQAASGNNYDLIIAAGGDGTVNEVANGLIGSDIPLGCLPSGTGNDITSSFGIPMDTTAACLLLLRGKRRKMDVGCITHKRGKRFFLGVTGIGYDAEVTKAANELGKRFMTGTLPYMVAIFRVLRRFTPIEFEVAFGELKASFEAMLVSVGNGPMYGGHMKICPNAKLDDNLFDLTILGKVSRFHLMQLFTLVYSGKHIEHHSVGAKKIAEFTISSNRSTLVQADGEIIGHLPMKFETIPNALSVITGDTPYFAH